MLGGQRQRAPVDHFPDAGQQVLAGRASRPPITITDGLTRFTQLPARRQCPGRPGARPGSRCRSPERTRSMTSWPPWAGIPLGRQRCGQRRPARQRLQTAGVAAAAGNAVAARHPHVPQVPGGALRAALQLARGNDAGADPGGHLDQHQVGDVGPGRARSPSAMMFTSLSTSTGTLKRAAPSAGTSHRSQPGMIGGLIGRPVSSAPPARAAPMPMRAQVRRPSAGFFQQPGHRVTEPAQHAVRAARDARLVARFFGQHRAGEVGHDNQRVRGTEVRSDHQPRGRVERKQRRRPAAGRCRPADGRDQPHPHQRIHAGAHRGPGQAVNCASSARVRGWPSRSSWNTSLAPAAGCAASRCGTTSDFNTLSVEHVALPFVYR